MTQISYWWTTDDTTPVGHQVAEYTQAHLSDISAIIAACNGQDGVAPGWDDGELSGTVTGPNTVQISAGVAVVDGKPYKNDAAENVNIPSAVGGGNTRIDRIVLRADWANFQVTIHRIAGTDAASPTPPALTQSSGVTWDLPLYQALVDTAGTVTLTNEREWAGPHVDDSTIEQDADSGEIQVKDDGIGNAKLRNSVATSVIGRSAGSTGDPGDIQATSNDTLLRRVAGALGFGQLTLGMIPSSLITEVKLAAAVVAQLVTGGDSHDHSGGDGATLPTGAYQNDSVDYTKVGNRVNKLLERRGGSASSWAAVGTTDYNPAAIKEFVGSHDMGSIAAGAAATATITFPAAFSNVPIVLAVVGTTANEPIPFSVKIYNNGASSFSVIVQNEGAATSTSTHLYWRAVGDE